MDVNDHGPWCPCDACLRRTRGEFWAVMTVLGILALVLAVSYVAGETPRSHAAITAFRKTHPCPATGLTTGACPNYRVDHVVPLCWNGADTPENMAWQDYTTSLKKDAFEREACRLKANCAHPPK